MRMTNKEAYIKFANQIQESPDKSIYVDCMDWLRNRIKPLDFYLKSGLKVKIRYDYGYKGFHIIEDQTIEYTFDGKSPRLQKKK